jgi:hypothetical protein
MYSDETWYEVVSPIGDPPTSRVRSAGLVADLRTARIAELWDYRFRGDQMFVVIEEELRRRFPGIEFVGFETFGDTHSHREEQLVRELPQLLADNRCTAVISSVGA